MRIVRLGLAETVPTLTTRRLPFCDFLRVAHAKLTSLKVEGVRHEVPASFHCMPESASGPRTSEIHALPEVSDPPENEALKMPLMRKSHARFCVAVGFSGTRKTGLPSWICWA